MKIQTAATIGLMVAGSVLVVAALMTPGDQLFQSLAGGMMFGLGGASLIRF